MKTLHNFREPGLSSFFFKAKSLLFKLFLPVLLMLVINLASAIAQKAPIGVLNIKSKGVVYDAEQAGNLSRMELEKLGIYEVMQKEDIRLLVRKSIVPVDSCYGKLCLVEIGKQVGAKYMLSGSIERFSEKIVITYRLFDVEKAAEEKAIVEEFLNLQPELQLMVRFTLQKLMEKPFDEMNYKRLTKPAALDNTVNNPGQNRLVLSGPRMGITYVTGTTARRMQASSSEGGYEINRPFMTIFGYQHEIQYLNEGRFQALVEILPIVSGLDVGRFVPSLTVMNGLRDNKTGWELAFGPTAGITQLARGYYDNNNKWKLERDLPEGEEHNHKIEEALDRRGDTKFDFSFVIAVGKTIRSGSMNLPVNAFIVTGANNDFRLGLTFGFNAKNRKQ